MMSPSDTDRDILLRNGIVLTPFRDIRNGAVLIEQGEVTAVGPEDTLDLPQGIDVLDVDGNYIAPGFIDMHLHGGGGSDTMDGTEEALKTIARTHAEGGTTAIVPTTLTAPEDDIRQALSSVSSLVGEELEGASILGAHVEGPYFSQEQAGAQNPDYLSEPKVEQYLEWLTSHSDILRFSAAPELQGSLQLARELRKRGILVSIGHSQASYQEVLAAVEAGYTHATHMYSGMSGLRRINAYRISGVIESTLLLESLTTEIIADGHHLPPSLMRLILKCKGVDKVALTTDAMAAAGLGPGKYELGGLDVVVEDDVAEEFEVPRKEGNYVAKLADRSAFAGSVATMDQLVGNIRDLVGLSVLEAVQCATYNPAHILGLTSERGTITPGSRGDIVVLDKELSPLMTVVGGRVVYKSEGFF